MKRTLLSRALAVAVLGAAVSAPALARPATDHVHGAAGAAAVTQLDGVVVLGVAPIAASTFVTDPKLPRQPVPASDGADYLKTIPGFSTLRSGGTNGDPVLRGMFGSRIALLTNDGALSGACPSRMDNAMSYIAPETYDRLTVIKGPQTVLWGGGASAGTVRFEREIPYFDRPGVQAQGSLLGGSNNRNDQVADISAGTPAGYARLSANRSEADDYSDGNGDEVPSAWRKWNADAAVGWTPDADTVLELSAGTGDAQARYAGRGMDGARFRRDGLGLRFEKKHIGDVLDAVAANVYRNEVDHVMDNYSLRDPDPTGSMPMPMASNVGDTTQGGRVALTWQQDRWEVTAGVDGRQSEHRKRSAMGRGAYQAQPWTEDARFRTLGVFAESHWHISEVHHLMSGLRIDRAQADDLRATTGSGMMPMPNPTAGQRRSETLPGGFVRYEHDMAGEFGWYAGVGHAERMPDYWELFSPTRGPAGAANAFAGVQPERTTQLDAGLQFRRGNLEAWASVYAGRIDDYILFDYMSGPMGGMAMGSTTRARNVDADIAGGEAGLDWKVRDGLKLSGVLAYAWGETAEGALPQMPPLEARLSASGEHGDWSWGTLLRIAAAQDRVSTDQGNVVGRDLGPSPGFAVFSLNGGYRFSEHVQLTAGIDNLFDRAYSEHLNLAGNSAFGYPADPQRINEPGRTAWVKLNFKY
ncbi:TonB-dependent copper receptor [Pseudoxanthomonas daejeonensis]|uniref:TonB-dependent copper receptor n=1 Tax=Pseudoxanthomonas daejeonensis TaxID=266062 RepID=A0ABQ6Z3J6_9GAMM|nr:TonB-dependent copper receptor [Pseudoxanthomonas daejeonensis]KAF1692087.1 TonB-dependent copper receptor [Pseudoxanthomonas daejeonensis]UNK58355.1 TonB-dependent copper receptor [Pseudoxanthomonas daejeonensis]